MAEQERKIISADGTEQTIALRELTAGDIIDALAESEKVVEMNGEPVIVVSPSLVTFHTIRRMIVRIGDQQGPLSLVEMRKLSASTLGQLQDAADNIDRASLGVARRGRDGASS